MRHRKAGIVLKNVMQCSLPYNNYVSKFFCGDISSYKFTAVTSTLGLAASRYEIKSSLPLLQAQMKGVIKRVSTTFTFTFAEYIRYYKGVSDKSNTEDLGILPAL